MGTQRGDERTEPAGVQLGTPARRSFGPLVGQVRPGAVDGLGHVAQMLLGMVDVDDFDGAGKLLGGDVPDPVLEAQTSVSRFRSDQPYQRPSSRWHLAGTQRLGEIPQ